MGNEHPGKAEGNILIADEDLADLKILSEILTTAGYEVRATRSGAQALSYVESYPPDLILLNIQMLEVNGYELYSRLKSDRLHSAIPIIFLRAFNETNHKNKGLQSGAEDFITKPFQQREVLARVDIHLSLSRFRRDLKEQVEKRTAEVREYEQRYRAIFETSPLAIIAVRDKRILFSNPAGARLLGFADPDEMIGFPVLDFIAPEFHQQIIERLVRIETGKDNPQVELTLIRNDGIPITVESTSVSIPFEGLHIAVVISRDITERIRLEINLKQSEERLRAFMDNSPSAMYIKDDNDRHLYSNPLACEFVNLEPDEVVGKTTYDMFPPEIAEKLVEADQQILNGQVERLTALYPYPQKGETFWFSEVKFPIRTPTGEKLVGGIATDISEMLKKEEELAERLEFEKLISDIGSKLSESDAENIEEDTNGILKSIGEFLKAERVFLARFSDGGKHLRFTNRWIADGLSWPPEWVRLDIAANTPWVAEQIRKEKVIYGGPGLSGIPKAAGPLKKWLHEFGVSSGVIVPISVEGRSIGMLGLDTLSQAREYPQPIIDRLKMLASLIGTMIERIKTQMALEEQFEFEQLLSSLSSSFIDIPSDMVDEAINTALDRIGRFFKLDRCSFGQLSLDKSDYAITHVWNRTSIPGVQSSYPLNKFPWFMSPITSGENLLWSDSDGLPKGSESDIRLIEDSCMKSFAAIPVRVAGAVAGMLAFASITENAGWNHRLVDRFPAISAIFGSVSARLKAEAELRKAYQEIKGLKEDLEKENIALTREIEVRHRHDVIGESAAIKEALALVEQVAKSDTSVLITGETGTGKELFAQAIHKLSPRSEHPMMTVNCAALPTTLIESELFGREKGAYTGAVTRQIGRFEAANRSTLLLDEVGEMPLEVQSKLLRVMQTGEFERLGGHKVFKTRARIIAATNQDLAKMCRDGGFRKDLYYRLKVFPINIPPLRERREDIPLLVWAIVSEFAKDMGKQILQIPQKVMKLLVAYHWPGNVRELRNALERAVILSAGESLWIDKFDSLENDSPDKLTMSDVETAHINKVLAMTGWRVSGRNGAAEILGLKPTTLESRMKKLGIQRPK